MGLLNNNLHSSASLRNTVNQLEDALTLNEVGNCGVSHHLHSSMLAATAVLHLKQAFCNYVNFTGTGIQTGSLALARFSSRKCSHIFTGMQH